MIIRTLTPDSYPALLRPTRRHSSRIFLNESLHVRRSSSPNVHRSQPRTSIRSPSTELQGLLNRARAAAGAPAAATSLA
jgi:hypothetical protein